MYLVRKHLLWIDILVLLVIGSGACQATPTDLPENSFNPELPAPNLEGDTALEAAIAERRSVRTFTSEPLTEEHIGQLLWAAQGITDHQGYRAAPSAGALYPLELYIILPEGLYHYQPDGHRLTQLTAEDMRSAVWEAGLRQDALREAPAIFLFTGVYGRTAERYGDRARRYVHMEAGHAAQNMLLQAVALDLGSVPIGAMKDEQLQSALDLPDDHAPLYLLPVGHPDS
ncbi:MAG: SagB/ThcOx family dehydrogenase [Anaerolineales bacterium]